MRQPPIRQKRATCAPHTPNNKNKQTQRRAMYMYPLQIGTCAGSGAVKMVVQASYQHMFPLLASTSLRATAKQNTAVKTSARNLRTHHVLHAPVDCCREPSGGDAKPAQGKQPKLRRIHVQQPAAAAVRQHDRPRRRHHTTADKLTSTQHTLRQLFRPCCCSR